VQKLVPLHFGHANGSAMVGLFSNDQSQFGFAQYILNISVSRLDTKEKRGTRRSKIPIEST
jgi:hypothetical protein